MWIRHAVQNRVIRESGGASLVENRSRSADPNQMWTRTVLYVREMGPLGRVATDSRPTKWALAAIARVSQQQPPDALTPGLAE